jgi:Ca2+-binding RTX toxin-like protein
VFRQRYLIAVVKTFLIGCALALAVVGCGGVRSEAPKEEEQGHTEATKQKQERSPEATSSEEGRCGETRPINLQGRTYTTNDVSGCPKGGLLSGTDERDKLDGEDGDDQIRGLGAKDGLIGGSGSDVIYGGEGDDSLVGGPYWGEDASSKDVLHGGPGKDYITDHDGGDDVLYGGDGDDTYLIGGKGEDVIYGGDGDDRIDGATVDLFGHTVRKQPDKLYCGEGKDYYIADKLDYVDSSCEVKEPPANL